MGTTDLIKVPSTTIKAMLMFVLIQDTAITSGVNAVYITLLIGEMANLHSASSNSSNKDSATTITTIPLSCILLSAMRIPIRTQVIQIRVQIKELMATTVLQL
jgi:hypothetical protein